MTSIALIIGLLLITTYDTYEYARELIRVIRRIREAQ